MDQRTNPDPKQYAALSPFQLKDELIRWARDSSQQKAATHQFLDAGRGNPNWVATTPREAFFTLGQFALQESKRVWDEPDLGGMPRAEGIADRLRAFLKGASGAGAQLLGRSIDYVVSTLGFEGDPFVHELVDGIVGDNYPVPDRMLVHAEVVVQKYLEKSMYDGRPPAGKFDLFAVEGGTAAMCYVFGSLVANRVLKRGDTIALGTPIFTPYLEMPLLDEFGFRTIELAQSEMAADGRHTWQYPDAEIEKLADPKVKAFFVVNPSNPASVAMHPRTMQKLAELVRTKRPDLILLTDDVYGTFIDGFRSLAAELPHNTILVYSYSKYFGCTGWRLGVVSLHEHNVIDEAIARLPEADRAALHRRYHNMVMDPDSLKFIDRIVADSRDVALNHTAGLSLPQQVQMTLFSLFALMDEDDGYLLRSRGIIRERFEALFEGLGVPLVDDPLRVGYYADLDLEAWGREKFGEKFTEYIRAHHDPLEIVLALARKRGTVLLNGSGFAGPPWATRVSLANLDKDEYLAIGRDLREVAETAVRAWQAQRGDKTNGNGKTAAETKTNGDGKTTDGAKTNGGRKIKGGDKP